MTESDPAPEAESPGFQGHTEGRFRSALVRVLLIQAVALALLWFLQATFSR